MYNNRNTSIKCVSTCFSFLLEPTPPGSIIISQKTNGSLFLRWDTPVLMDGAPSISYNISYQHDGGEALNTISSDTHTELTSLLSGKSYNITVQTVGPQSLKSTAVQNASLTCKFTRSVYKVGTD